MRPRAWAAALVDVVVVVAFVAIGRREHDAGSALGGIVTTAAPFLFGLLAGWLGARAWRRPTAVVTGVLVWLATLIVGMFTRRAVFSEGTATSFVVVASLFLGCFLIGWRLLAARRGTA